jgi:hypothetical protein
MKYFILNCFFILLFTASCKNETKSVKADLEKKQEKTKLISIQQKITIQKGTSDTKILLNVLSENYPQKYTCSIVPNGIIKGDINGDGFEDILFRYTVDEMENRTWVACGWCIVFSNNKSELEKYIYFDWSSGPCAPSLLDLGFPTSIENGVISSNIDDYDSNDDCCCPSIKRNMKFTYDMEFNFLSLSKIETIKQNNNE